MLHYSHQESFAEAAFPARSLHTLSIMVGSAACNAECGFCSTKMEPVWRSRRGAAEVDWPRFHAVLDQASAAGIDSVQLTGAGEPTLFPHEITAYLRELRRMAPRSIELQTNGILLDSLPYARLLTLWQSLGLTSVAVSMAHHDSERNAEIYSPGRALTFSLDRLLSALRERGVLTRLACTLLAGYVDSAQEVAGLLEYAARHAVDQVTLRPVRLSADARRGQTVEWCREHLVPESALAEIERHLERCGEPYGELPHGGKLFVVQRQLVCFVPSHREARHKDHRLIFFTDGRVHTDWG